MDLKQGGRWKGGIYNNLERFIGPVCLADDIEYEYEGGVSEKTQRH